MCRLKGVFNVCSTLVAVQVNLSHSGVVALLASHVDPLMPGGEDQGQEEYIIHEMVAEKAKPMLVKWDSAGRK